MIMRYMMLGFAAGINYAFMAMPKPLPKPNPSILTSITMLVAFRLTMFLRLQAGQLKGGDSLKTSYGPAIYQQIYIGYV